MKISKKVECWDENHNFTTETGNYDNEFELTNLLPGKKYNCTGKIIFGKKDLEQTSTIEAATQKVSFRGQPGSFNITLTVDHSDPKWDHIFYYKEVSKANFKKLSRIFDTNTISETKKFVLDHGNFSGFLVDRIG